MIKSIIDYISEGMHNIIFKILDLMTICIFIPVCIILKSLARIVIILIIAGIVTVWAIEKTVDKILDNNKQGTIPYHVLMSY